MRFQDNREPVTVDEADKPRPNHNRASRRQQLGMRRTPARGHKEVYARRGAEHREVINLHRELQEVASHYRKQLHQAMKHLLKLG